MALRSSIPITSSSWLLMWRRALPREGRAGRRRKEWCETEQLWQSQPRSIALQPRLFSTPCSIPAAPSSHSPGSRWETFSLQLGFCSALDFQAEHNRSLTQIHPFNMLYILKLWFDHQNLQQKWGVLSQFHIWKLWEVKYFAQVTSL